MEGGCSSSYYDHFSEKEEVISLIEALPHVFQDLRALETAVERLTVIVDKYQEQPHLLDPHLNDIISKLFEVTSSPDVPPPLMHLGFKCVYLFSKLRGPKIIVRWFSHEVSDLEPVLSLLQQQDITDHETWETRYVLLLWLYVISMIPFDLTRLDGSNGDHTHSKTITRLIDISKLYLGVTDKSRDAAVLLCARLLSRHDVQKMKMKEFLDWTFGVLKNTQDLSTNSINIISGILKTFIMLHKIGKREDLLHCIDDVLTVVIQCQFSFSPNTLIRKQSLKLIQRLGMTFLPSRQLSWRYGRGSRSLEDTLATQDQQLVNNDQGHTPSMSNEEEDFDIPEQVEDIIGQLLTGLRDKDTVVRWTAAKGIGRITGRLPLELANEIVGSILEIFSSYEDDSGWHGGCLALAELGRRGLLLPLRLPEVVPVVLKALVYEERRGACSLGAHVRDAACYVCWSFARAYEPSQLAPYVTDIAQVLVPTMLFDREVNCRRAASAAFQENVGRQGNFPHGIDILTMADYFAVGNIPHVYLEVSVKVGRFPEYTRPLIDHLVNYNIHHWDSSLREYVSQALHRLTFLDPSYVAKEVFPVLIDKVTSPDLWTRHGSLCAVSEIMYSLHLIETEKQEFTKGCLLSEEIISRLQQVIDRLLKADAFKGMSGEILRPAALKFIDRCCLSRLPVKESIITIWQSIIDDNIPHTEESIREVAVNTLRVLCETHYCTDNKSIASTQNELIPRYQDQMKSQNRFTRMGFSLGIGHLPRPLLEGRLDLVLSSLKSCASLSENGLPVFTEARRDAIKSINNITSSMSISIDGSSHGATTSLCRENIPGIFHTLFEGMNDYTTDSRGDIGSIVRETCINGLTSLCCRLSDEGSDLLTTELVGESMCLIIQQCNEKIDRTRSIACGKLITLVKHEPQIKGLPHHRELLQLFNNDVISDINWSVAQSSFPLTVQLLSMPTYSYHALMGLVVSTGGLTESLVRYSSSSFLSYLKTVSESESSLISFSDDIMKVFTRNRNDPRVIIPLLKTLDLLLGNGIFELFLTQTQYNFSSLLLDNIKIELKGCKDPIKILTAINTLCGLLQFKYAKESTLNQLMILLGHSYPKVRRTTADQLYTTLLTYDDILHDDEMEPVMSLLSDVSWDEKIETVRIQRNELCNILKLPVPKSKVGARSKPKKDQNEMDYKDLVSRMGY